jgi:hypothetical protein
MSLFDRLSKVNSTNPYFAKDLAKAAKANKFIGRGSSVSSTEKYRIAAGDLGNCGVYSSTDVVFISVEGNRRGRVEHDVAELEKAIMAGATFITDDKYNRMRSYNCGERAIAELLTYCNLTEVQPGVWK